ncbi:MAG TPA: G1 family glutamic endopeptidase [Acidimicrobiales bacterium]|nr:G1 family glutamic endopeptidase [Acidimicrobiales bacterium]
MGPPEAPRSRVFQLLKLGFCRDRRSLEERPQPALHQPQESASSARTSGPAKAAPRALRPAVSTALAAVTLVPLSALAIGALAVPGGLASLNQYGNPSGVRGVAHAATSQVLRQESNHSIDSTGSASQSAASSSSVCWESENWSGYAVASAPPSGSSCSFPSSSSNKSYSGKYTSVSATWTVPTVTSSVSATYSSLWTGIDGFTNNDLIQAGTSQFYTAGKASYFAWWEILPASETTISSITVQPGDSITVSIAQQTSAIKSPVTCSSGKWLITLTDNGSSTHAAQKEFASCQSYSGPDNSAEYIVEAPEVNGSISSLADYTSATFGAPSVLEINGADMQIAPGTGGEMVQRSSSTSKVVSVPSEPDSAGDAFSCAYGSSQPAAP